MAIPDISSQVEHEFSVAALLIKEFPRLTRLSLENYVGRASSALSYTLARARLQSRLEWFLHQHNRAVFSTRWLASRHGKV